jgi:hypothetical protein
MEFHNSAVTVSFDATWRVILIVSLNTLARVCVCVYMHTHTDTVCKSSDNAEVDYKEMFFSGS